MIQRTIIAMCVVCWLATSGCGYRMGAAVCSGGRTVHVPTFTTDSFRRGFELQLTESVEADPAPDSVSPGQEPGADDAADAGASSRSPSGSRTRRSSTTPRELEMQYGIEIKWEDVRTGQPLAERSMALPGNVVQLLTDVSFAPETGQSPRHRPAAGGGSTSALQIVGDDGDAVVRPVER